MWIQKLTVVSFFFYLSKSIITNRLSLYNRTFQETFYCPISFPFLLHMTHPNVVKLNRRWTLNVFLNSSCVRLNFTCLWLLLHGLKTHLQGRVHIQPWRCSFMCYSLLFPFRYLILAMKQIMAANTDNTRIAPTRPSPSL